MTADATADVLIIGSGAGGATVAHDLALAGYSVLILERGPPLPVEADNWNPTAVFIDRKYRTSERWLDRQGRSFRPNTHYWAGGNTSFYGAALMRMKREDFQARMHPDGLSPAWPFDYDELAPWYAKAEALWRVHGQRGLDPTDDPADPPLPFPALAHDPGVARLAAHFQALGWTPSPLPLGVNRIEQDPAVSPCIRCRTCGGYPCQRLAKSDARSIALAPLRGLATVRLETGVRVTRLETDPAGRSVTGVLALDEDGQQCRFSAPIVVLAAGAVNTAALLLASASDSHPAGLANGSGQVGRNYMFHTTSAVISIAADPFEATFPKTLTVMDFYHGDPARDWPWPMGQIQLLEYMTGQTLEGQIEDMIPPALLPDAIMNSLAGRMVSFLAMTEDLPDPDNRVTLEPDGTIRLSYTPNNLESHKRLVRRLEEGLTGFTRHAHTLWEPHFQIDELLPLYGTAHQCGTARCGTDPATSVVDGDYKAHEIENLYLADSAVFCSSAAVNPTLTIVAGAMRLADHLARRLGRLTPM
jgi:choline dehydrogenase-like flavoprotein